MSHSLHDPPRVGPSLAGVSGRPVTLRDGAQLTEEEHDALVAFLRSLK